MLKSQLQKELQRPVEFGILRSVPVTHRLAGAQTFGSRVHLRRQRARPHTDPPRMVDDECKEEYLSHRAVEYGVATHMLKREDAWCRCEDTDGCFTFGVFDGHGGAELSHKCSELLPAKLHDAASDRAIEDAFWEVDAELGRQALTQGTTASCLCIRPTEAGHDIMLAWVGDSRVIEVDMMAGSSNLVYRTSMHQPDNDQERRRIEMQWKARQAMRDREADEATTPVENISAEFDGTPLVVKGRLVGGTPVVTKDDLLDAGLMDDGTVDLALAARGLEYEARLNAAPPLDFGGRSLKRVDSMIARRLDPYGRGRIGPRVVETVYLDLQTSKLLPGPSTCMTRSIGDWDSARVCLPHPEVHRSHVRKSGAFSRFVIASDGLWDVCNTQHAAAIVSAVEEPQKASDALMAYCKREYLKLNGLGREDPFGDDVTILVVDVTDPTSRSVVDARVAERVSGACSVACSIS